MSNYQTLMNVNKAVAKMLREYVAQSVAIRFDLPDVNATQADAAISVFLYDIHEDLQLRTAESRGFNPGTGRLSAGWVNIQCNYLITYWESTGPATDAGNPDSQPDNQAIQVMSQVLDALINNRQLADIPGAYTQIIPPKENLNSLGNFWQSLGNRPRLSLHYCITVPVSLSDKREVATPVTSTPASVEHAAPASQQMIAGALRDRLVVALGGGEEARLALTHVELEASQKRTAEGENTGIQVALTVTGVIQLAQLARLKTVLTKWHNSDQTVATCDGYAIYLHDFDTTGLTGI